MNRLCNYYYSYSNIGTVTFMFATSSSDATAMAWNWVIQSISKFKQVDSPTLAGLVDKAPELSVDIGKDAKEMVSLRMLQRLFPHGNDATIDSDSSQNAEIMFDSSEHGEDILNKILKETSESMTELKRRKWSINPLIIHKNASLPETPMQKFKEALFENNHPILESLKEMSKTAKVCENTVLKTENESRKLQQCPLQKPHHVENVNEGFTKDTGRIEDEMMTEPPKNNLVDDDDTVDHAQQLPCDEDDDLVFMKNENSKLQISPLQKPDHVEDSNKRCIEDIGREDHEMTIDPLEKDLLDDDDDNVDHGQRVSRGEDDEADDDLVFLKKENVNSKLQERPLQKPDHVEVSNKRCIEDIGRREHKMTIESPENDLLGDDDDVDHGQRVSRGENDEADDDLVFLKKENVNSKLQELPLQKHFHVEDTNKGITEESGNKEHETTSLPMENDDDDDDNIEHVQQPPCEAYDDENVGHGQQPPNDDEMTDIAAKKEAFLSSQFTLTQDFVSTVDFTETYLCMKCNKGGQLLVCNSDACPFRVHERCLGSAATFDESEVFFCPFCSYSHAISKYMEVKKKASLARKDLQVFSTSGVKHRPNISSKTNEHIKLNGGERVMSRGKNCASVDSDHQSTGQAGVTKQPSEDKESPVSSTSSHSKRARKREPQCTSSTIILPRRKNLFWEKSEEEKLKEGMEKFSGEDYKRIPWKKILDFGRDVFDKSWTTIDLKDKWRNICKEGPAVKKQKL
ncbi:uncharacterized protein LOC143555301 [Bidens hawaiensis]|uniref:uncharacterized protein LOC143555301 n=1 Tax=Bidens hawaiensis TaxID=980011 RepID=UPI004049F56D